MKKIKGKAITITAGAYYTLLLTDNNEVYAWGCECIWAGGRQF